MAATMLFQKIVTGGLALTSGVITVTDDGAEVASPVSVLAAQAGTLTTRTNDTSGTITMTSGSHGITTGQRVDLYFVGGSCYGAVVGTVSGTTVPIASVQGGDILPLDESPITVGIPESVPFDVDGDNVSALCLSRATASVRCQYVFLDAEDNMVLAVENASGQIYTYDGTGTNPLAEALPVLVWISHEYTGAADSGLSAVALKH